MHQGSQMGGLHFDKSPLFLKQLGGEKQLALCGENVRGKESQKQHLRTRSLFCEDVLTYVYYKCHEGVWRVGDVPLVSSWSHLHPDLGVVFSSCWALLWQSDVIYKKLLYGLLWSQEGCAASPGIRWRLSTLRGCRGATFGYLGVCFQLQIHWIVTSCCLTKNKFGSLRIPEKQTQFSYKK